MLKQLKQKGKKMTIKEKNELVVSLLLLNDSEAEVSDVFGIVSEYYPIMHTDPKMTVEEYITQNVYDDDCLDRILEYIQEADSDEGDDVIHIDNLQELEELIEDLNIQINEDNPRLVTAFHTLNMSIVADAVLECECNKEAEDISEEHF